MVMSFSAEWLKTKRTFFRVVLYSSPLLFHLLIFGYAILTKQPVSNSRFYFHYFSILNFLLPFMVSFILALLSKNEQEAGNFKNIFGLNRHYYYLVTLKFVFSYSVISLVFLFNALLTIGLLFSISDASSTSLLAYFISNFSLTWIAFTTTFILLFFLSILCGFITMLMIGLASSLLTAIIGQTALGNGIWVFFPFTWHSRLTTISTSSQSFTVFFNDYRSLSYALVFGPIPLFLILLVFSVSLYRRQPS